MLYRTATNNVEVIFSNVYFSHLSGALRKNPQCNTSSRPDRDSQSQSAPKVINGQSEQIVPVGRRNKQHIKVDNASKISMAEKEYGKATAL